MTQTKPSSKNSSKSSSLKPFVRVTILSAILAALLIYLGINYHWGDFLKASPKPSNVLSIPVKPNNGVKESIVESTDLKQTSYNPEIIDTKNSNALLDSMNKEQITEHCSNLLSTDISDSVMLELATVNCVMSNYQETFQNTKTENEVKSLQQKRLNFKRQCANQYNNNSNYSLLQRELLIGICVSDRISSAN